MARIDLYGERKATLYRSFKEGILSEQEYIAEANACATKADELRILPMSLKKRRRSILPSIKGVSTGRSSSKSMAIAQSWTLQWWTP